MSHEQLHEARLWKPGDGTSVRCQLCAHRCTILDGGWGLCGVRTARGGTLYSTVWGKAAALNLDPIEKKPLFHFYPGTSSLSVATVGCNLSCRFCQNWSLSQVRRRLPQGETLLPEEIVGMAREHDARTIAFTYSEPTIFFEYARDTAQLARESSIDTVFVTNGFMTPEALAEIAPVLGGANVDLKCFRDDTYRKVMGGGLQPVLDTLRAMTRLGVWVEVTTLVIPQLNDTQKELEDIAGFIADELGPDVPWHVSRFHPDHEMLDRSGTPIEALQLARRVGRQAGLRHVYTGNIRGDEGEHTYCHQCGATLIRRHGFRLLRRRIVQGDTGAVCRDCGAPVAGVAMAERSSSV